MSLLDFTEFADYIQHCTFIADGIITTPFLDAHNDLIELCTEGNRGKGTLIVHDDGFVYRELEIMREMADELFVMFQQEVTVKGLLIDDQHRIYFKVQADWPESLLCLINLIIGFTGVSAQFWDIYWNKEEPDET